MVSPQSEKNLTLQALPNSTSLLMVTLDCQPLQKVSQENNIVCTQPTVDKKSENELAINATSQKQAASEEKIETPSFKR